MNNIHYHFASIDAARMDIQQSSARLNAALSDLKNYLAPLVASWEGEAAEAYQVQQNKWDRAQDELNSVLERIGRAVGAGNDQMNETNHRAATAWS